MSEKQAFHDRLPGLLPGGPPNSAFAEAVALLTMNKPDLEGIAEALRVLDEPNPRKMVGILLFAIELDARYTAEVAAGEGQAAEATRLEQAHWLLRQSRPTSAKQAEGIASDLADLDRRRLQAENLASLAKYAASNRVGLRAGAPRLFGEPAAGRPGILPVELGQAALQAGLELVQDGGWLYSRPVASATPTRRARAVGHFGGKGVGNANR